MFSYLGAAGLYLLGWYFFWRLKLQNHRSNILAFHCVDDKLDLSITRMGTNKFRRIIEYLKSCDLHGTSLSRVKNNTDIALTFDDGWRSFYISVLPVLREHNFTATVFVISGYVGKKSRWDYKSKDHLTWSEIKTLIDENIEIGSHSVNHVDLRRLDDKQLEYEVVGSKKQLEDKLGIPIKYFSYPFGRYDDRVIRAVSKAGYEKAYTLGSGAGDFAAARHGVYLYDTPFSLNLKLFKGSALEDCKSYINNSLAGGTITLRKLFPVKETKG